jgi:hypothetical protein
MRKVAGYIISFFMWIFLLALGVWIMVVSRDALLALLARNAGELTQDRWQAIFFDKIFMIAISLVWIVLMVVGEEYLRRGVEGKDIMVRFAKLGGPMILLLFLVDLCLFGLQNWAGPSLRLPLLAVELVAGGLLLWHSRSPKKRKNPEA